MISKHYPKLETQPLISRLVKFILRKLLHEREINAFADEYGHLSGLDFVEQVLEYFHISVSIRREELERIPTQGKCVIVANHPLGSLDALALIKTVMEIRPDLKVVANEMLMAVSPLHELFLPVNNMGGKTKKQNLQNIQSHLQDDGVVMIFPSGEVSRLRPQGVRDTKWNTGFLRIAKLAQTPVLPVYIHAKNSPYFYGVSMLFKPLATSLLVREMFKQNSKVIGLRIGDIIPYQSYSNLKVSPSEQANLFRKHIYRLGKNKKALFETQSAIALPEDRRQLRKDITQYCEQLGETKDGKKILIYRHSQSCSIMREIGRLREISFRAVGEGTNKRRDIDSFDRHYFHLILWDEIELEIAGAYRFGDAKKLAEDNHDTGLYSATLFDYQAAMTPYLMQGLELGRSFVQPKYWGNRSLDYLWIGIGAFVKKYPNYRYLFGPVSIPGTFPHTAIHALVEFYSLYFGCDEELARPKTPFVPSNQCMYQFSGDDYKTELKILKDTLSHMGLKIPTLLKQYSEVTEPGGSRYLAFNRDPDFNDCIDGLVMVDMHKLTPKKKERYLRPISFVE